MVSAFQATPRRVRARVGQLATAVRQLRDPWLNGALREELSALGRGCLHGAPLFSVLVRHKWGGQHWVDHWAEVAPRQRAISDEHHDCNWEELKNRSENLALHLQQQGVAGASRVVVFCPNSVFMVVALIAVQRAGAIPVLLDSTWDAHLLDEAVRQSGARHVIIDAPARRDGELDVTWVTGETPCVGVPAPCNVSALQPYAMLFTSGTTGHPKLVALSAARAALSGFGMGHMCLNASSRDAIYCALPLSHATALMTGLAVSLITGAALVLRQRFSAKGFWPDVAHSQATRILYVGEMVRRLINEGVQAPLPHHRVTMLYGTGMPLEKWDWVRERFKVPRILEFYGATELPLALVNMADRPGFIGRTALSALSPWKIVRFDESNGQLLLNARGHLIPCDADEPGELMLGRKRTFDIVVRDAWGYVKLLDRQGASFRQNGFNVPERTVEQALIPTLGVRSLAVTHVTLPNYDGHPGLLVVACNEDFEPQQLAPGYAQLPSHARPRFVRLTAQLRLNRGLKCDSQYYRRTAIDPLATDDRLYVYGRQGFTPIDRRIWRELQLGTYKF